MTLAWLVVSLIQARQFRREPTTRASSESESLSPDTTEAARALAIT
jgi:hypothetical protein